MTTLPTDHTPSPDSASHVPANLKKVKRAAAASILGTTLEYYEFYIYASAAALVFPHVFFPTADPYIGMMLSLSTFAIGSIVRPIAAGVLGHYGDRLGRKKMLMITLGLMGLSTFLIGCLPSYDAIGLWAPGLLVLLRIMQGISVAGEQAGSGTLTLEHAPVGRRGFFCSFTPAGTAGGFLVATAVFGLVALMPDEDLLAWGWRLPFYASILLVIAAFLVRRYLDEPEVFEEAKEHDEIVKSPVATLFRTHKAEVSRVFVASLFAVLFQIPPVFGLAFATSPDVGVSRTTMLWVSIASFTIALLTYPLFSGLSDRIGRKPVFIVGTLGSGLAVFPYLAAITAGNVPMIFATGILVMGLLTVAANAVYPSFFGEMFNVKVRFTGLALGTQVGFALAGFAPAIGWALIGKGSTNWLPVAVMVLVCCVLASIAAATAPETYKTPVEKLGNSIR
ncbi:MFS transporter [Rhodococcus opacus]|uniref:MFS transporter n=1 Tax=Rhodococcus opacus TaxID=37919 RepID=UPI001C49371A|nr:MFS transporter [Rhodococcus opacus]MBV6756671.1 MHS family MFS transporter [Rhodococcus opacus]